MKKRVLSMLLAFILCFSTLPMTAFAQEADAVTEQEEQQEAAPAARAGRTAGSSPCGRAEGSRSSCGTGGRDSVR